MMVQVISGSGSQNLQNWTRVTPDYFNTRRCSTWLLFPLLHVWLDLRTHPSRVCPRH
jgi:hypothetical protein